MIIQGKKPRSIDQDVVFFNLYNYPSKEMCEALLEHAIECKLHFTNNNIDSGVEWIMFTVNKSDIDDFKGCAQDIQIKREK